MPPQERVSKRRLNRFRSINPVKQELLKESNDALAERFAELTKLRFDTECASLYTKVQRDRSHADQVAILTQVIERVNRSNYTHALAGLRIWRQFLRELDVAQHDDLMLRLATQVLQRSKNVDTFSVDFFLNTRALQAKFVAKHSPCDFSRAISNRCSWQYGNIVWLVDSGLSTISEFGRFEFLNSSLQTKDLTNALWAMKQHNATFVLTTEMANSIYDFLSSYPLDATMLAARACLLETCQFTNEFVLAIVRNSSLCAEIITDVLRWNIVQTDAERSKMFNVAKNNRCITAETRAIIKEEQCKFEWLHPTKQLPTICTLAHHVNTATSLPTALTVLVASYAQGMQSKKEHAALETKLEHFLRAQ